MKILFIVVLGGDLVRSTEHLGVAYLSSYLQEKGYTDVSIKEVFGIADKKNLEDALKEEYDVVGFSTTCVAMREIINIGNAVKEKYPNTHITMGGHMATFWGKEILERYSCVDSTMRGEGEITCYELIKATEKKESLENIEGITYKQNNEVIANPDRLLMKDLDVLPFPVRNQFELHDNRFQYLRICSSRGCLGKCGFCSSYVGRTQKDFCWRGRSPKNVADEVEELVKKYNFHTYDFVDSTFEDPGEFGKQRIGQIAHELIDRDLNIFYNCCFRAEDWYDSDRELLRFLIDSGLEKVNIGFESGNDRGLKLLYKRARSKDNQRVIKLLADFPEIYITFGFIMFHPDSILEDLKDNADFLYGTGIGQVIRHYFWKLEVYPATAIEEKLKKAGRITVDYDICDGMYAYEFLNPKVSKISDISQKLLSIQEVWDFEIFDILVHTFISRMLRKYSNSEIKDELDEFIAYVNGVRAEMAKYNHEFFMDIYDHTDEIDVDEKAAVLKQHIKEKMALISNKEYRFGMNLKRRGYELVQKY